MNEQESIHKIKPQIKITNMEEVEVEEIEWLWYPYIPYGKITIVQGDPASGKTTFVLQMSALLSKGTRLPCSDIDYEPINIIYQTAEDGIADTIKPRLLDADADCTKINVIDETEAPLTMMDARIEEAIKITGAKLVILDPLQAYLGSGVDMHRANEVRPVMNSLGIIAMKYNCAVILIGHMNKSMGGKSSYRGLGSIDFQAIARSVLIVGSVKENKDTRVVVHDKGSLAHNGDSIAFELSKENGFSWLGEYDMEVDELLYGESPETKKDKATKLILEELSAGQVQHNVIANKAKDLAISQRVLNQAKKELNVKSVKQGACWYWRLP